MDQKIHRRLARFLPKGGFLYTSWKKPEDFLTELRESDFHIGARLHSLILADIIGVPAFSVSPAKKVVFYLRKTKFFGKRHFPKGNFNGNVIQQFFENYGSFEKQRLDFIQKEHQRALKSLRVLDKIISS